MKLHEATLWEQNEYLRKAAIQMLCKESEKDLES